LRGRGGEQGRGEVAVEAVEQLAWETGGNEILGSREILFLTYSIGTDSSYIQSRKSVPST
jgi:hypothetical protein